MAQETVPVRKVLLVAPQMEARGTSEYTVNLATELKGSGVEVVVFCVPGPTVSVLEREGVSVRVFERLRGVAFRLAQRKFLAAVDEFSPQLAHAHSYRATSVLKCLRRQRGDVARVLTLHGLPEGLRALRRLARLVDGIIATTQSVREGLVNQCRVDRRKIQVIHNGIDVEGLARRDIPPIFQAESPAIGSVGPIEEGRGHELFVRASSLLVRGGLTAQFVIAGEGDALPGLRDLIGRLGMERYVTLASDFAEYEDVLGALDVVVQSSLVDVSGFSILEAMGHRRPVVAFNTGTACEMIEDGRTGFLVPKGDVEALAAAIKRLITEKDRAREMGECAWQNVKEKFDIKAIARRTLQFYADVLAQRPL